MKERVEQIRFAVVAGALLAGSGVALGALGAHGLEGALGAEALTAWATAVEYQLTHAVALLALVCLAGQVGRPVWLARAVALITAGVVLFSGSLYALALGGPGLLGPVTPAGGLLMILGWLAVVLAALPPAGGQASP